MSITLPDDGTTDDALIDFGEAVGLINEGHDGTLELNEAWFADPAGAIEGLFQDPDGRDKFFALIAQLMGEPNPKTVNGKQWYPLRDPRSASGAPAKSGPFLVREEAALGVGIKRSWLDETNPTLTAFALLPLVDMQTGDFLLDQADHPFEIGVAVDDLNVSLKIYFTGKTPDFDASLNGQSITDDPGALIDFLLDQVIQQADSGSQERFTAVLHNLKVLLNPPEELAEASWPSSFPGNVDSWFHDIAAAPARLGNWLHALHCLFQGKDVQTDTHNVGAGTAADPYVVALYAAHGASFALTLERSTVNNLLTLTPGFQLASPQHTLADGLAAQVTADLTVATLTFNPDATVAANVPFFSAFNARVVLKNPEASLPLFAYDDAETPVNSVRLGTFKAGVELNNGSFTPFLQLTDTGIQAEPITFQELQGNVPYLVRLAVALLNTYEAYAPISARDNTIELTLTGNGAVTVGAHDWVTVTPQPGESGDETTARFLFALTPDAPAGLRFDAPAVVAVDGKTVTLNLVDPVAEQPSRALTFTSGSSTFLRPAQVTYDGAVLLIDDTVFEIRTPIEDYVRKMDSLVAFDLLVKIAKNWLTVENLSEIPATLEAWIAAAQDPPALRQRALEALVNYFEEDRQVSTNLSESIAASIKKEGRHVRFWIEPDVTRRGLHLTAAVGLSVSVDTPLSVPGFDVAVRFGVDPEALSSVSMPSLKGGPELSSALTNDGTSYGFSLDVRPTGAGQPYVALLPSPTFYKAQGGVQDADDWLLALAGEVILPLLGDYILQHDTVKPKLDASLPVLPSLKAGALLEACGILDNGQRQADQQYHLVPYDVLKALEPKDLLANAFVSLFDSLTASDELLLYAPQTSTPPTPTPPTDGIYLTTGVNLFGLRVQMTDLSFGSGELLLQIGNWPEGDDGPIVEAGMPSGKAPGIHLNLLKKTSGTWSFDPRLEMVGVGLDLLGKAPSAQLQRKPLLNVKGYQLGQIQTRLYLLLDPSATFKLGFALRADTLSFPLAPPPSDNNPVAKNLLGSGSANGAGGHAAVPPTFSATLAYVTGGTIYGQLQKEPPSDGPIWFPVDQKFGPFYCRMVGLDLETKNNAPLLIVGYEGNVAVGPLRVDLVDLSVGIPLEHPTRLSDYTLGLDGLGIAYDGDGVVKISGAFLREEITGKPDRYAGAALIETEALTLSAVGAYEEMATGDASLFLYAVLDKPMGGPPFFFVTGLAAGFGYNRRLITPTLDEVEHFPLITAATASPSPNLATMLGQLNKYLPPAEGDMFLAVGVRFTSFKMIESFALLTAAFGERFELNLMGLSTLTVPVPEAGKTTLPLAKVQIALLARYRPDEGVLKVDGKILPGSYVFTPDCHLSGGFAFYSWFSGQYEGDFVLTVGGYHPNFNVPDHYPNVERLALNWKIDSHVSVKGSTYFALTASMLMAGGHLEATYKSGAIKAWFKMGVDFLIAWKPYYYEASMYMRIGASYTFSVLGIRSTLKVEVGADLQLWGPPFSGTATIDLSVVSFTVKFGGSPAKLPPLTWDEFKETFLPNENEVCTIASRSGLLNTINELWVVNPRDFSLAVETVIPFTVTKQSLNGNANPAPLAIRTMDVSAFDSTFDVKITGPQADDFEFWPIQKNVPAALWGPPENEPNLNGERFIEDALAGIEIRPKPPLEPDNTAAIDRKNLKFNLDFHGSDDNDNYEWGSSLDSDKVASENLSDLLDAFGIKSYVLGEEAVPV